MIPYRTARIYNPTPLSKSNKPFISISSPKSKLTFRNSNQDAAKTIKITQVTFPEVSPDENQLVINENRCLKIKNKIEESKEEKQYKELVTQYNKAMNKNKNKIPSVNYTILLKVIDTRIKEINNKDVMAEKIRKRMKVGYNCCHWNLDKIIKKVEDAHLNKPNSMSVCNDNQGFDEMTTNEIRQRLHAKYSKPDNSKKKGGGYIKISSERTKRILKQFKRRVTNCLETIKQEYNVSIKEVNEFFYFVVVELRKTL